LYSCLEKQRSSFRTIGCPCQRYRTIPPRIAHSNRGVGLLLSWIHTRAWLTFYLEIRIRALPFRRNPFSPFGTMENLPAGFNLNLYTFTSKSGTVVTAECIQVQVLNVECINSLISAYLLIPHPAASLTASSIHTAFPIIPSTFPNLSSNEDISSAITYPHICIGYDHDTINACACSSRACVRRLC
jgi:hypothetical protein